MPCNIKNPANIDLAPLEPHIQGMYDHFDQKFTFKKPPVMVFDSDPQNKANVLGKTAYYDPDSMEIHIYTDGRHPKDMLRSIAHELIHHRQNLEGRLNVGGYHGEGYYLENKELQKLEHEAMLEGNAVMREYEDTIKKENNQMSLKEWKNNELNKLLLKKFGILKENKQELEEIRPYKKRDDEELEEEKGKYDDGDGKDEKCDHVPCEDELDEYLAVSNPGGHRSKRDEELEEYSFDGGAKAGDGSPMEKRDDEDLEEVVDFGGSQKRDDEDKTIKEFTSDFAKKRDDEDKTIKEFTSDFAKKRDDEDLNELTSITIPDGKRDDNKLKHRNESKVNLKQLIEKVLKNNKKIMKKLKDK